MGTIRTVANTTFRENVIDGNPLSGNHPPSKADIRGLFGIIEDQIDKALASNPDSFSEFAAAPANTNANSLTTGFWVATAAAGLNFPLTSGTFRIESWLDSATAVSGYQKAQQDGVQWFRTKTGAMWSAWNAFFTEANFPKATVGEAQAGVASNKMMDPLLVKAAILAQGTVSAGHQRVASLRGALGASTSRFMGNCAFATAQAVSAFILASGEVAACGSSFGAGLPYAADTPIQTPRVLSYESGTSTPTLPFVQVATTQGGIYALDSDGWVWSAGLDGAGALGHGTAGTQRRALKRIEIFVANSTPVSEIIAPKAGAAMAANGASDFVLFRLVNGQLWACGANITGQLGDGTTVAKATPVRCGTLTNIVEAKAASGDNSATGGGLSAGRDASGNLYVWGANSTGAVGDGSTVNRLTPFLSLADVVDFDLCFETVAAVGFFGYIVAVLSGGATRGVGSNNFGQLGDGTQINRSAWATGLATGVAKVATGGGRDGTTVYLLSNGQLRTIGFNAQGQTGSGDVASPKLALVTPQFAGGPLILTSTAKIAVFGAGGAAPSTRVYACVPGSALMRDLYGWGVGTGGALKTDGAFTAIVSAPRKLTSPAPGVAIADFVASGDATAAGGGIHLLLVNGRVYGTGGNPLGSLGTSANLTTAQDGWSQVLLAA